MQKSWPRGHWHLWLMLLVVPVAWVGQNQIKARVRDPQAILVLGGAPEREHFAADWARQHADLQVWVSSGTNPEYAEWLFHEANIDFARLHLDYRAVDTVTNFTTVVTDLKEDGIRSVYIVTSDYHMRRALIIAQIVLGRHDIAFRPISVPSEHPQPEPIAQGLRDGIRASWWVLTGQTGSSLRQNLKKLAEKVP